MAIAHVRAALFALIGAATLAAPARADWTAYGGDPEHHFYSGDKLTAPLGVLWKHATNLYSGRGVGNVGGPIVSGNVVYFPSRDRLYAVDANTGELKWRVPEADAGDATIPKISATPTTNGQMVYVPDATGNISAYRAKDGTLAWNFRTGSAIRSSPTLIGDSLYFGSDDDFLYNIDANTGALKWKSNDHGKPMRLSDDALGSPTYYNDVIYINSGDMRMWAFEAASGRFLWQTRMGGATDASPVAYNGRIYLAAGTSMYQFRLRGGQVQVFPMQQWVDSDITTTPIITDRFWFFGDRNGNFHAFNTTGKPVMGADNTPWKVRLEGRPVGAPIMTPDTVYLATDKGFLYGINLTTAQVTWSYRTEAPKGIEPLLAYYPVRAPMAVDGGHLYVLGDDGTLTCFSTTATDTEGPTITTPRPTRGTVMNGTPPLGIAAYLWDEGSGINTSTIELRIDDKQIDEDAQPFYERVATTRKGWVYNPVRRLLTYTTPKAESGQTELALADGRHTISVGAADWKGNYNELKWDFIVDNTLPKGAVAVKPTAAGPNGGQDPMAGGYPGVGGPGGPGQGGTFRGRLGGYTYGNRGQNGYNNGQQGGGQSGGFGRSGGGGSFGSGGGGGGLGRGRGGGGGGGYGR
jgi:outer membrane protein assembly factor BamB